MKVATAWHALVTALVLMVCLALPRPGSATLLVPLGGGQGMGAAMLALKDARVLGRGRLEGSLVLRADQRLPLWALLRQGIVPIGVPLVLCGQAAQPAGRELTGRVRRTREGERWKT